MFSNSAPKNFIDANTPFDIEGRVHHLGLKKGEVSNLIITVGDFNRAKIVASFFENQNDLMCVQSNRGFLTITGLYKNKKVSVIAIGMGMPMMDFMVREVCSIIEGPIIILRFGSCGTLSKDIPLGSLALASGCFCCTKNYDYLQNSESDIEPYCFSQIIKAEEELPRIIKRLSVDAPLQTQIYEGLNMSTDSFYSSQGRKCLGFTDNNDNLLKKVKETYQDCLTLEMETYILYHLARCSTKKLIRCFAAHMVFANRVSNQFIDIETRDKIEPQYSKLLLDALTEIK